MFCPGIQVEWFAECLALSEWPSFVQVAKATSLLKITPAQLLHAPLQNAVRRLPSPYLSRVIAAGGYPRFPADGLVAVTFLQEHFMLYVDPIFMGGLDSEFVERIRGSWPVNSTRWDFADSLMDRLRVLLRDVELRASRQSDPARTDWISPGKEITMRGLTDYLTDVLIQNSVGQVPQPGQVWHELVCNGWAPAGRIDLNDVRVALPFLVAGWKIFENSGHFLPSQPCTIATVLYLCNHFMSRLRSDGVKHFIEAMVDAWTFPASDSESDSEFSP